MKLTRFTTLLALGLVLTVAASACRKRPGDITRIPGQTPPIVKDNPDVPPIKPEDQGKVGKHEGGYEQVDPELRKIWQRDPSVFANQTVYFDFDSSTLKAGEKSKVAAVAEYFKTNNVDALEVDGHCDERGTEEYNRSLGERRALALREELVGLGVSPARIDTVSYGKDRPKADGHDESVWKQNRRGEFLLEVHPKTTTP